MNIAARYSTMQVFASMVRSQFSPSSAWHSAQDYIYLFERYFYFLETLPLRERGLVVFDGVEKTQAHGLLQQMAAYFLGHEDGRYPRPHCSGAILRALRSHHRCVLGRPLILQR